MSDLNNLFSEVKRVIRRGEIFAFTIAPQETAVGYIDEPTVWDVSMFIHSPQYIMELLETNGLKLFRLRSLPEIGTLRSTHSIDTMKDAPFC